MPILRGSRLPILAGRPLGVPAFIAANVASSGTGTLTLTKPTGTVDGHLMVTLLWIDRTTSTLTPPAGWTHYQTYARPESSGRNERR